MKKLFLNNCEDITFQKDTLLNLEKLDVYNSFINKPESLIKLPNVRKCKLKSKYYIIEDYKSIFDLQSFKNIIDLSIGINEFADLDCSLFYDIKALTLDFNYYDINHKSFLKYKINTLGNDVLNKIVKMKTLTSIDIPYLDIKENIFQNDSILILIINVDYFIKDKNKVFINNIQKKFPNLLNLVVRSYIDNTILKIKRSKKIRSYKFDNRSLKKQISITWEK